MKDKLIERLKARKQIPISIASRAGLESPTDPLCLEAAQQGEADNARIADLRAIIGELSNAVWIWVPSGHGRDDLLLRARALTQEATNMSAKSGLHAALDNDKVARAPHHVLGESERGD